MKQPFKMLIASLTLCGVLSAYAACWQQTGLVYCVPCGASMGYYTYQSGEACYPGTTAMYSNSDCSGIWQVNKCETWEPNHVKMLPQSGQTCYWAGWYYDCYFTQIFISNQPVQYTKCEQETTCP